MPAIQDAAAKAIAPMPLGGLATLCLKVESLAQDGQSFEPGFLEQLELSLKRLPEPTKIRELTDLMKVSYFLASHKLRPVAAKQLVRVVNLSAFSLHEAHSEFETPFSKR